MRTGGLQLEGAAERIELVEGDGTGYEVLLAGEPIADDVDLTLDGDVGGIAELGRRDGRTAVVLDATEATPGAVGELRLRLSDPEGDAFLVHEVGILAAETIVEGTLSTEHPFVTDPTGSVSLVLAEGADQGEPLSVRIERAESTAGMEYRFRFDRELTDNDGPFHIQTPPSTASAAARRVSVDPLLTRRAATYPQMQRWTTNEGAFLNNGEHRLPPTRTLTDFGDYSASCGVGGLVGELFRSLFSREIGGSSGPGQSICIATRPASALDSALSRGDPALDGVQPVLLVHGYTLRFSRYAVDDFNTWRGIPPHSGLGGGESTWGGLPGMLLTAETDGGQRVAPFEFRWNSNARFEDVAGELLAALVEIQAATGERVKIVAHSFGGVLTRTALQGFARTAIGIDPGRLVSDVVTLGTPHSGILEDDGTVAGQSLPDGQDALLFSACAQVSCHQMGEDIAIAVVDDELFDLLGVDVAHGELVARLADTDVHPLPEGVSLTVGIGLSRIGRDRPIPGPSVDPETGPGSLPGAELSPPTLGVELGGGDGLISYAGQRFHPEATVGGTIEPLLSCDERYGGIVTETVLGVLGSGEPGDREGGTDGFLTTGTPFAGYAHNGKSQGYLEWLGETRGVPLDRASDERAALVEANIDCDALDSCTHGSALLVRELIASPRCSTPPVIDLPELAAVDLDVRAGTPASSEPVSGAFVQLRFGTGPEAHHAAFAATGEDGRADAEVPLVTDAPLSLLVTAPGYLTQTIETDFRLGDTVEATATQLPTVYLQRADALEPGGIEFAVIDATTGANIGAVSYTLRRNGAALAYGTTDDGGVEAIAALPPGEYTLAIEKESFGAATVSCTVQSGLVSTCEGVSLRSVLTSGQVSIRLTWDSDPRDLDSHLAKRNASGALDYRIYFSDRRDETTDDNLDLDDTSSFGPETTTIQEIDPSASYVFAVHHYSGSGSLTTTSAATVVVDYGGQSATYTVPARGAGRAWRVFEVIGGAIIPCRSDCIRETIADALTPTSGAQAQLAERPRWVNRDAKVR